MTENIILIDPSELYTILNQYKFRSPLCNPRYLLLLDTRTKDEYDESHIIMAKRMKTNAEKQFIVPFDSEIECQENIVVYDGKSLIISKENNATKCALTLISSGSGNPIKIVNGGYELFSKLYPFLRTQKILWMPRELEEYHPYPLEVIPKLLYLGNLRHASDKEVQKQLKIKAHINCTNEIDEIFTEENVDILTIPIDDDEDNDISRYFESSYLFIDRFKDQKNAAVLVYSELGLSRSVTIVLAYMMAYYRINLAEAWDKLSKISFVMRPNRGFIKQLAEYEKNVVSEPYTDISDPYY